MHNRGIMIFNTYIYVHIFTWMYLHMYKNGTTYKLNAHSNGSSPYGFSIHPLQREAPSACLVHEGANRRRLRCHGRLVWWFFYFSTMGFISITSPILGKIYNIFLHVFLPNHLKLIKVRYAEWRHPFRHISSTSGRWDNDLGAQRTSPSTEDLVGGTHCWHFRTLLWKWWCLSDFDQLKNNKCTFFITNDLVCRMCVYIYILINYQTYFICTESQSEVAQKSGHGINVKVQGSLQRFECKKINPRSLNILRQDWNGKKLKCQYQVRTVPKIYNISKCHAFPTKNLNITTIGVSKQQASSADSMTLGGKGEAARRRPPTFHPETSGPRAACRISKPALRNQPAVDIEAAAVFFWVWWITDSYHI